MAYDYEINDNASNVNRNQFIKDRICRLDVINYDFMLYSLNITIPTGWVRAMHAYLLVFVDIAINQKLKSVDW